MHRSPVGREPCVKRGRTVSLEPTARGKRVLREVGLQLGRRLQALNVKRQAGDPVDQFPLLRGLGEALIDLGREGPETLIDAIEATFENFPSGVDLLIEPLFERV